MNTEWIMIIKDNIPVQKEYQPEYLGLYLAKPSTWYFRDENSRHFAAPMFEDDDPQIFDFICLFKRPRYSRLSTVFSGKQKAIEAANNYISGKTEGMPDEWIRNFEEIERGHGFPQFECKMQILGTGGEVHVMPHEYSIVDRKRLPDYTEMIGNEYEMHMFGGEATGKDLDDRMFYLNTRGISKSDALQFLLGDIESQDVCFLKPHPQLASHLGLR